MGGLKNLKMEKKPPVALKTDSLSHCCQITTVFQAGFLQIKSQGEGAGLFPSLGL